MADPADDEPDRSPPAAPHDDGAEDDTGSLVEQVKELAEDARTAVEAEIAWQSARAGYVGGSVAGIAAWAGFALVSAFIAVLALAFGAILALTPIFGAAFATLIVTGVLLLAALIAALVVRRRVRALRTAAFPPKVKP